VGAGQVLGIEAGERRDAQQLAQLAHAEARVELLRECGRDARVAAIILDVVLGYGANPDPAAILAPVCEAVMAGDGPQVVVYVLGTERDPQGFAAQRNRFVRAGAIVTETAARASLVAAAIATRDRASTGGHE